MNWKLILMLSLLGLAMGIITIWWVPTNVEMYIWPLVILLSAWFIAKNAGDKPFQHGLGLGLVNSVWVTGAHLLWVKDYMAFHTDMQSQWDAPLIANHPRLTMGLVGLGIGVASGIVIGLLSWLAAKMMARKA